MYFLIQLFSISVKNGFLYLLTHLTNSLHCMYDVEDEI
jgi:hypothetical protein